MTSYSSLRLPRVRASAALTPKMRRAGLTGALLASIVVPAAGCVGPFRPAPVIRQAHAETSSGAALLDRVLVAHFRANLPVNRGRGEEYVPASQAAAILTRLVSDELEAAGIHVLSASDPADPTGVVRGEVRRYRDLAGGSVGANRPASVSFQIELVDPATGEGVWTGLFDETQQPLSSNVVNALRYPGGGTRWLSAFDLAQWGVGEAVAAMRTPPVASGGEAP